jgi:PTS system cellobiose-specific IIB component
MTRTAAIVCGAGVSSTFLARALRRALAEQSSEWTVEPLALDQVVHEAPRLDHVILGEHLETQAPEIIASLALVGVPATLLSTPGTGDDAAREALAHLTDSLTEPSGGPLG